jgi:hypothetical protein
VGTRLAKISGTLTEVSGEELARQQGMDAAPTSPLGARGLGASQDVAKMAGTGEQVRASLRETLKERTMTKDVMGEAERGTERARFDVARIQTQMQTLTGLGSLDNRIAEQIRQNLLTVTEGAIKNTIDPEAVRTALSKGGTVQVSNEQVQAAVTQLSEIQSKTLTAAEVSKALNLLGISSSITETTESLAQKLAQTGVFKQATVQDIKALMDQTIERQSKLKISELIDASGKDISGIDKQGVANILDIKLDVLDEWTLEEVKAALQAYSSQSFANVDELRDVLASPAASQSQKDFARKRLAELGAIGVTSLEEKTNDLQRQMEEGDTVKFGNRQVRVSELLTDPELKAVISNALATPEGLADLEKSDAELANWVKANQAKLVDIRAEIAKGTEAYVTLQTEYNTLLKDMPADVLDKLTPNWRDAKTIPVAEWVASLPPAVQNIVNEKDPGLRAVKSSIMSTIISKQSPDLAKQFSSDAINAIATAAGGDQAKAASLTQDWIDSTQSVITGLTSAEILKDLPMKFDEDYTQDAFNSLSSQIIQLHTREAGQTVDGLVKRVQDLLAQNTPESRSQAVQLYKQLGDIRRTMKNKLSPANVESIRSYTKTKREADNLAKTKQEELNRAQARTSLTPRPVTEVLELLPQERSHLLKIADYFKESFGSIGDDMRVLIAGGAPEAFKMWMASSGRAKAEVVNGVLEFDVKQPTLDDMILYVAHRTRSVGSSKKHYSAAADGSRRLFSLRDELEAAARNDVSTLSAQVRDAQANAAGAKNQYDAFVEGLITQ